MTLPIAPARFYRYRGLKDGNFNHLRQILLESQHYFTSPASFNDPFDCRPVHRFNASDETVRAYLERLFLKFSPEQVPQERAAEIDAILADPNRDPRRPENQQIFAALVANLGTDRTGVLCLSEAANVPLMWSHYADSHAGVCVGFDSSISPFSQAFPITYSKLRPSVDPTVQTNQEMLDATLFTKSLDWSYEKEWRIVHPNGSGTYKVPPTALKEVILGAAIKYEHMKEILAWTRDLPTGVEVYRASASQTTFEVELRRYR